MNLCVFGDLWQLPPPGNIAIMQDPKKAMEKPGATYIMNMFWGHSNDELQMMQSWTQEHGRVLHMEENRRSGADKW